MKKALIIRLGALGDCVIISPVIRALKKLGYYIVFNTSKRGQKIYRDDPDIDETILHEEDMPFEDLPGHWEKLNNEIKPDLSINFTGSIEDSLAIHPIQPLYTRPKYDRAKVCDVNYYESTRQWAIDRSKGALLFKDIGIKPDIFYTDKDHEEAKKYIRKNTFNIVWCLSGSGKNKVYPWTEFVMGSLIKEYPHIHIITVGDERCKILESINKGLPSVNFTELAGEIDIKVAMLLTKYASLVISPDTCILHASGAFDTPKIGLLGHTTRNNITKFFDNDYSLEADCNCAPCFHLIYEHDTQCPIEPITTAAWCMAQGLKPERVFEQIKKVIKDAESKG